MHPIPEGTHTSGEWLGRVGLGSDAGREILARDWAATPLGDLDSWPENLRLATRVVLSSRFPMMIVWGPDLTQLYNDAFRPILGRDKHPHALGDSARHTWSEIWTEIGPLFATVLDEGQAVWSEDQRLVIQRNGYPEETFFTYSYSPVHDDAGAVSGLLVVSTETTSQVVDRRRLASIGSLATALVSAATVESVADATVRALARNPDLPAIELHLIVDDQIVRVASPRQPLTGAADRDMLRETGSAPAPIVLDPEWTDGLPARRAAFGIDDPTVRTVVVAQLNEQRPFDVDYRQFLVLVRQLIAASMAAALRRAAEVGELRLIADTLQHAMLELASDLPTVAARYRPAEANMAVGGDWYEVVDLGTGRRSLIVGDCVGHGLVAATAMGALRNVSRAVLSDGQGPADVLSSLHRFAKTTPSALGATVVCAVVDLHAQSLTYANGGHPPPLLLRKGEAIWLEDALGPPLAVGDPVRTEAQVRLQEDDVLVLYTDGLIERRGESIDVGLERLAQSAIAHGHESVQSLADHLIADLVTDGATDDVALVVKRVHRPLIT
jgi:Stage II sporulation protein E (SpoIIE)